MIGPAKAAPATARSVTWPSVCLIYRWQAGYPVVGMKSADALDLITMLPLMAAERPQSDIGRPFRLQSDFLPAGDQPQAIDELCLGLERNERDQVLLGVTGSGKTFTM